MNNKIKYPLVILGLFVCELAISQSFLSEKNRQFKSEIPTRSVMPGASLDFNGDLIDDIVVIDRGNTLKTIKSSGKHFELTLSGSVKTTSLREWSLAAGDLNNDGLIEIITTGEYSLGTITTLNNTSNLTKKSFTTNVYAQGSSVVDINNDGWLDYFLCNEDGPPKIYLNDKTGTIREKEVIPFLENDNTDGSGNYGAVWVDVNGDYLPDLVLSKCKAGVTDSKDKRRINRLYINNGDGTFTESGAAYNLNSGAQTWVTAVADFDNDGDMDALVVNHYSPHQLMENVGFNHFKEIPLPEVLSSFSFQAVTLDIDNDGFTDILLTGVEGGLLLHNKGNMQFDVIRDVFGRFVIHSFSVGDYNDDGFPDIHAHLGIPINEVGVSDDQLWMNNGNDNHFIKINLRGTQSNLSAIGSHLTIYTPAGKQIRTVKGGESYGICNSFQQIFGLGINPQIDSLVIRWPSGLKETYNDLTAGYTYLAQEGKCISKQLDIYDEPLIFKNEAVQISAPEGYSDYHWSNGQSDQAQFVSPGLYHVSMTDASDCLTISKPIKVISGCFSIDTDILKDDYLSICINQPISIVPAVTASKYIWQDGTSSSSYLADNTGWITLTAEDYCGQTIKDSVYINTYSFDFDISVDSIYKGQSAILQSTASLTKWYKSPDFDHPVYSGSTYKTEPLDTTTIFGARATSLLDYKSAVIGEHELPISNPYHINSASGSMVFNVESACIIHKVTVSTDIAGIRRIYILKEKGDTVFARNYNLDIGISELVLDAELTPGDYTMATDEKVNLTSLGFKSPRLVRTTGKTTYPYTISEALSITTSTFGPTAFLYFYDWEIYSKLLYCESDLKSVSVIVDTTTSTKEEEGLRLNIRPNPVMDRLYLDFKSDIDFAEIKNSSAQILYKLSGKETYIDMGSWPSGMYILSVYNKGVVGYFKIIKL